MRQITYMGLTFLRSKQKLQKLAKMHMNQYLFRCFLAIPDFSVENSFCSSVLYFLIGLFGSLESQFFTEVESNSQIHLE